MPLHKHILSWAALATLGLAGCTAGNGAVEPGFTSVNLNANKVTLAVGVATFVDGSTGLNVVAAFRQPNGLSGTLLNTPTLTGPFTVPNATSAGVDAGTNHITGSPQALPGTTPVATTFGQSGGLFAYGFAPANSTTSGAANFALYTRDFYGDGGLAGNPLASNGKTRREFRGGPPAYPYVRDGTYPTGFNGYTLGFTTFALTPVAGTYNLSLNIPSGNNPGATLSAPAATLANATGLPAFAAAPAFTPDGAGGGTATCTAPPGVTETLVEFIDTDVPAFYTVRAGGGAITAVLPPTLGPGKPGAPTASIATGDTYAVECIGADYPLYEAGPPQNVQQVPTLTGATGQTDITFSPSFTATY